MSREKKQKVRVGWILVLLVLFLIGGAVALQKLSQDSKKGPTIYLEQAGETTVFRLGDSYEDPGYTATAADGRDLTAKVEYNVPDMEVPGEYTIKYKVEDRMGNRATAKRKIKITFPAQTKEGKKRGLAILMYHDVYDAKNPPAKVDANMISTETLEKELQYLQQADYYFPTWAEVREYLDGEIDLPEKSVVLTFDDAAKGFIRYGAPLLESYPVKATSFVITSKKGKLMVSKKYKHISLQSHSHNMHRPGGNIGHGGVFTALSHDEAVADMKKSQSILGNKDAFAYPFGDYDEDCVKAVEDAGFLVAFTTQYGKIHPGDNPYLLPRVRVNGNISLEQFKDAIE